MLDEMEEQNSFSSDDNEANELGFYEHANKLEQLFPLSEF